MPHLSGDEIARPIFDGAKELVTGSPIFKVLLVVGLVLGGTYLKAYMESIRETKPMQFAILFAFILLILIFSVVMLISEWK